MKNRYKYKFIAFFLAIIMIMALCPVVHASTTNQHAPSLGLYSFFESEKHERLISRAESDHISFVENLRGSIAMKILGHIYATGDKPSEDKYAEVLISVMKTFENENATSLVEQNKIENANAVDCYGIDVLLDAVDVAVEFIPSIKGASKPVEELGEWIKIAIGGLKTVASNTNQWIEGISKLETIIQNYANHHEFLTMIEKNSDSELKKAATTLKSSMKKTMEIKLDTYTEISKSNFSNYTEFFFDNLFFEALKQTDLYNKDIGFRDFVKLGTKVFKITAALNLGTEIGKIVGNIVIGSENVVNRVLDMEAIYDISEILENQLTETKRNFKTIYSDETDEVSLKYISYGNYLISSRIRGEYYLYSLLAKDAGLYSFFGNDTAKKAEQSYNKLTSSLLAIKEELDDIPNVLVVETINQNNYETVNENLEIHLYDINSQLYDNYTLRIYNKRKIFETLLYYEIDATDNTIMEHKGNNASPLQLSLEKGYTYTLEFVDNSNTEKNKVITVGVTTDDPKFISIVDVKSDFGIINNQLTFNDIIQFEEMLNKTQVVWGMSQGFDSNSINFSHFATRQGMMLESLYSYFFGEREYAPIDPRKKFVNFNVPGASVYDLDKVKWIMNNIFNVSFSNDIEEKSYYIDSDKLYIGIEGMGWATYMEFKVIDAKIIDDNRYAIKVSATQKEWNENGKIIAEETYTYVVHQYKEDNNNYWAIDSFTKDSDCFNAISGDNTLSKEELDKLKKRNNSLGIVEIENSQLTIYPYSTGQIATMIESYFINETTNHHFTNENGEFLVILRSENSGIANFSLKFDPDNPMEYPEGMSVHLADISVDMVTGKMFVEQEFKVFLWNNNYTQK